MHRSKAVKSAELLDAATAERYFDVAGAVVAGQSHQAELIEGSAKTF